MSSDMGRVSSFLEKYKEAFGVELNPRSAEKFVAENPENYLTLSGLCPLRLRLARHIGMEVNADSAVLNKIAKKLGMKRHEFFFSASKDGISSYLMRSTFGAFDAEQQAQIVAQYLKNVQLMIDRNMPNSDKIKQRRAECEYKKTAPVSATPEIWPEIPTMFRGDAWELWQRVGDWQRKRGFR